MLFGRIQNHKKTAQSMQIRPYHDQDIFDLLKLFKETVHTIGKNAYSREQLDAWAPEEMDVEVWRSKFTDSYTIIAEDSDVILGFASLKNDGCIDLLYVSHMVQRRGVATLLYQALESQAKLMGIKRLISDVSLTAREFFIAKGFVIEEEYTKSRNGVEFRNALMEKNL
jgi:GNAT superfamily N-acetyltransferase